MCVSDSVEIKVINTVNQEMEGRFGNGGRLKVIVTEPDPGEEKRDRQTERDNQEKETYRKTEWWHKSRHYIDRGNQRDRVGLNDQKSD